MAVWDKMLVSSPRADVEDRTGTRVKQELVVEQSLRGNLWRDLRGVGGKDCSINCFSLKSMPKLPRMLYCIQLFHDVVHVNKMIWSRDSQDVRNLLTFLCSQNVGDVCFSLTSNMTRLSQVSVSQSKDHLKYLSMWCFCSVQFSCSVVSSSLWPHGLQYARPPCPSPTPRVYSHFH